MAALRASDHEPEANDGGSKVGRVAKEGGRYNIRSNMVVPGIIDAGLGASFLNTLYLPDIWDSQRKRVALQRFGTAITLCGRWLFSLPNGQSTLPGKPSSSMTDKAFKRYRCLWTVLLDDRG